MTQKASNRGQLIDIARSYLSGDNFVICREDIPQMIDVLISKVKILDILHVINWAFFPEQKPNYGDQILLQFPPEQITLPHITIYDKNTELIDGCKFAIISPCL